MQMKRVTVLSLVGLAIFSLGLKANAAVFRLNGVQFEVTDPDLTGYQTGIYTISGEFKRDTAPGNSGALTAWNITLNGPNSFTYNWVRNTTGYTDNSNTFTPPGLEENIVNFYGDPALATPNLPLLGLTFANDFDTVYIDPAPGVSGSYPVGSTGKTLLNIVDLQNNGSPAVEANVVGQADFVPFAPSMLFCLPLLSALKKFRRQLASL